MWWIHWISGFLYGSFISIVLMRKYFNVQRKHPYTWHCPNKGCWFEVGANEIMLLDSVASNHERTCECRSS